MRVRKVAMAFLVLLAMTMNLLGITVVAEGGDALVALSAPEEALHVGDALEVSVETLTEDKVTNGKLVVTYDAQRLEFAGAEPGPAWGEGVVVPSVNPGTPGRLILAFAGSPAAGKGVIFTLSFTALKTGVAGVRFSSDGYIGGAEGGFAVEELHIAIKGDPVGKPTLTPEIITYGQTLSDIALSGALTCGGQAVPGTFTWAEPDTMPNAGTYEAAWEFAPEDADNYFDASGTSSVTVRKALPAGEPGYTQIDGPGKTLADAQINNGTISVPGVVAWEQDENTTVYVDRPYNWTFTPDDTDNYEPISGAIVPWTSNGEPHVHTWGEWDIMTPAGCETDGLQSHTCSSCGATETQPIPALGHDWGEWDETPATCEEPGSRTRRCQRCDAVETEPIPALGHDYRGGVCVICGAKDPGWVDNTGDPTPGGTNIALNVGYACKGGEDCPSHKFADINFPLGTEEHAAMDYLIVSGLMTGVTEEEMAPEAMMDRASAIAMLYRAAGSPDMTGGVPFLDAVPGSYYFAGVAWAWDRGITAGVSANSFAPMALLNREQLVTFLYRFAGDAGLDTSAAADLTDCADVLSVSPFALDPMRWAVGTGLIDSGPVLDPLNPLTRSQAGKLIWRFLAYIG